MQMHQLQKHSANRSARRVGRGGKRGKTSGRGTKGQKARAGNKRRPEMRDIIKKYPKRRGYGKNRSRTVNANREVFFVVNVGVLEERFSAGQEITPAVLTSLKIIRKHNGRMASVKVLGNGILTKKLAVRGCAVSAGARKKIESVGGSVDEAVV